MPIWQWLLKEHSFKFNFTKPGWGGLTNHNFVSYLFEKQTFFKSNIKRNKGIIAKGLVIEAQREEKK